MALSLRASHPHIANLPCQDCITWVHDMKTGVRETFQCGSPDNIQPVLRVGPPPCQIGETCPKESPDKERLYTLSRRNEDMLDLYHEHRAMGGVADSGDAWTRRGFRIIEEFQKRQDAKRTATELAIAVMKIR